MSSKPNNKEIPADVLTVWAYQKSNIPVGTMLHEHFRKIIKDNPEFFPWESKYDTIPKEVHDAHKTEKNAYINDKLEKERQEREKDGEGSNTYHTYSVLVTMPSRPDYERACKDFVKKKREVENQVIAEKRKLKQIWDKHYAPYGLQFRG